MQLSKKTIYLVYMPTKYRKINAIQNFEEFKFMFFSLTLKTMLKKFYKKSVQQNSPIYSRS